MNNSILLMLTDLGYLDQFWNTYLYGNFTQYKNLVVACINQEAYEVLSNEEKRKKYDLELESLSPSISLDDYNNILNERNTLINELNSVRNELYNYKNRTSYNFNNTQNYNYRNQNINNYNTSTSQSGNAQNNKTGSQKRTYYYTDTGKPASAFDYFKYRIREFFSNIILLVLIVLVLILMLNAFLPFNLFSLFFKR